MLISDYLQNSTAPSCWGFLTDGLEKEIVNSTVKFFSCLKWELEWSPSLWWHASPSLYCCIRPSTLTATNHSQKYVSRASVPNCTTAFTRVRPGICQKFSWAHTAFSFLCCPLYYTLFCISSFANLCKSGHTNHRQFEVQIFRCPSKSPVSISLKLFKHQTPTYPWGSGSQMY